MAVLWIHAEILGYLEFMLQLLSYRFVLMKHLHWSYDGRFGSYCGVTFELSWSNAKVILELC